MSWFRWRRRDVTPQDIREAKAIVKRNREQNIARLKSESELRAEQQAARDHRFIEKGFDRTYIECRICGFQPHPEVGVDWDEWREAKRIAKNNH